MCLVVENCDYILTKESNIYRSTERRHCLAIPGQMKKDRNSELCEKRAEDQAFGRMEEMSVC